MCGPETIKNRQQGVGLIEVMVAVIILSIGFLAAGRMQSHGIRAAQEAYIRSQAHFLVKDMADRMRINITGVRNGDYDLANTLDNLYTRPACASSASTPQPCSPQEIAQNDLAEWASYINPLDPARTTPLLPSGPTILAGGTIEADAANDTYTITVRWSQIVNGVEEEQSLSTELLP